MGRPAPSNGVAAGFKSQSFLRHEHNLGPLPSFEACFNIPTIATKGESLNDNKLCSARLQSLPKLNPIRGMTTFSQRKSLNVLFNFPRQMQGDNPHWH